MAPRTGAIPGGVPTRLAQAAILTGIATVSLDWFIPFEIPPAHLVEPGLSAAWTQYHTGFLTPPVPSMASWHQPYAEPVRVKPSAVREQAFTTDAKWAAPSFVTNWWQPLSQPVWSKPNTAARAPFFATDWKSGIPAIDVIYAPFSEPVRSKPAPVRQGEFQTDWKPTGVAVSYWWSALSEPVQTEPGLGAAWTQYHTGFLVPAATGVVYNWFSPLSEPVLLQQGLGAPYQQVSTVGTGVAFIEYIYPPFSEPVRVKPSLHRAEFLFLNPTTPTPAVTDLRNFWFQRWTDPVWPKPGLHPSRQQFLTTDWKFTSPAFLSWHQPYAEPVRSKQAVAWQQFLTISANYTPFVFADSWWRAFSEPVRAKPDIRWREPFTTDWQWNAPVTPVSYWFSGLAEPVRTKESRPWQVPFVTDWKWTPPSYPGAWWKPFSEPVRAKQDIRFREPFTTDWKWTQPSTQTWGWYQLWREPVWPKPGLHASRQQFFVTDWQWRAPVQLGWYQWLREPVRQKPGIHASRVPFFQMDWKWSPPIVAAINYTLNATEQGDSARLFYAAMDIVVGAYVTITEEEVGNMAVVTITARSEG